MKTSELTGAVLDWAVAKCEGFKYPNDPVFKPSTNWAHGGPIIEREMIETHALDGEWEAYSEIAGDGNWDENIQSGPTPLIAAMRCYVASKLGDDVDVPKELT